MDLIWYDDYYLMELLIASNNKLLEYGKNLEEVLNRYDYHLKEIMLCR
jgi:hypothetical protein